MVIMLYFQRKCEDVSMINIKKFLNLEFYTSQIDQFLAKYSREHNIPSESQLKEKQKYARIFKLRDQAEPDTDKKNQIWDKF
jgi:hypothetical protein